MSSDLHSKCRTCLCESTIYHQLEDFIEEKCTILEMLDCIVPQIDVKSTSQFSCLVCPSCVEKLLIGYKFQQSCIETHNRLHELMATTVFETEPEFEIISDPLRTEPIPQMKEEYYYEACYAYKRKEKPYEGNESSNNRLLKGFYSRKCEIKRRRSKFPCTECGQTFSTLNGLKQHKGKHSSACIFDEKTTDMTEKRSRVGVKQNEDLTSEMFGTDYKCSRDNSENELNSKSGGCKINTDEVEKGNKREYSRPEKQARFPVHQETQKRKTTENNYPCTICPLSFISMRSLTKHITNKHPETKKHKCDQCDKTFVLHSRLVKHLSRHKCKRNAVCLICKKNFAHNKTLKEHMRTHSDENPYLCTQCGKTFRSGSSLSQHMETHRVLKKYQCPECPSRFKCKAYLAKHAITHSNTKPHVCDVCGSRFARKTSLQTHKLLHSGERPYKCDQCSMTFAVSYHLRRHLRTHTGEKPYSCKYCARSYAESGDLTKHLRTHVGENTYMCDQCPVAFKYQSELRQHQSHHYKVTQTLLEKEEKHAETTELNV